MTMDDAYATCVIGYHLARLVGEDKVKEIVTEGKWDDPAVLQMAQDIEELASNGYYSEMVGSNVWPAGQNTELALGTAAMYLNGSWLPNEVKDMAGPDFHWGASHIRHLQTEQMESKQTTSAHRYLVSTKIQNLQKKHLI